MNFRRNLLLSMALLTAQTASALAQQEPPITLSLSQVKPSELFQLLLDPKDPGLLPMGITMISPDDEKRYLLIRGTEEGVKRLRELIRLVDVPQKTLRVEARVLLQNPVKGTDKPKPELVGTATIQMTNNRQGEAVLVGQGRVFRIQITPHINGDGSFTLFTRFKNTHRISQENGQYERKESEIATSRRMAGGVAKIISGLPVGNEQPVIAPLSKDNPTPESPFLVNTPTFLLEVTPTILEAAPTVTATPGAKEKRQTVAATKRKQPGQLVK